MAQEIDINLNVNAEQADKSLGSLKSQLKQAQAEVQTLADKFGATSAEAVNAAKKAADLKDRIGDAKSLTDAFNPDAKFKSLSASLTGVAGGFAAYQGALGLAGVESKKLQEQLLQVQSAMALAQGLQGLGEARDSFKQLGAVAKSVFAGIKNAIGATGIGLLVIALGAIYAYWDDIKEAVNGVSNEQKKLNQLAEKNVQTANDNLKAAKSTDNTLKLQGKSEQQILDIKIKATQQAIDANVKRIKGIQKTNELEAEAAQRNYERLKSFLDFVSIPQRVLFETAAKAINKVIDLVNKIPGVEITGRMDEKFADQATDYLAKLAFDPEKTKAEGAANLKATQDAIRDLTNERDGYTNSKNKKDEKNNKDSEKSTKDALEAQQKLVKDAFDAEQKLVEEKLKNDKISIDEKRNIVLANDKLSKEDRLKFLLELQDQEIKLEDAHNKSIADLNKKYDDEKANRLADTNVKKEMLNYDRAVLEIENLAKTETEKHTLIEKLNAEHALRLAAAIQSDDEKKVNKYRDTVEAVGSIAQSGENLLAALQANGLARNKAGQAVMKGLALVQIAADSAIAFSKMMQGTEASATGASLSVPPPAAPATYLATKVAFYASGSATILANLARARALLGSGGGGGATAATATTTAAPSFNIVGPSGANQIAESIGNKESQPLKAYVVGGDVTTQQSLNRGIVQNATLG